MTDKSWTGGLNVFLKQRIRNEMAFFAILIVCSHNYVSGAEWIILPWVHLYIEVELGRYKINYSKYEWDMAELIPSNSYWISYSFIGN